MRGHTTTGPLQLKLIARSKEKGSARAEASVGALPAVVGEGLVGFRHLLEIFTTLARRADAVAGVENFVGHALGHRALTTITREADHPTDRERGGAAGADLNGHLVGRATDTAAANLKLMADVVDRTLQDGDGIIARLLLHEVKGVVHDALGGAAFAALQDLSLIHI